MAQAASMRRDEADEQIDVRELAHAEIMHAFDDVLATLDQIIAMTDAAFADDPEATRH